MTVNLDLLDAALARIDAHPETWDQSVWWCGTAGRLAGHVLLAAGEDPRDYDYLNSEIGDRAAVLLGIEGGAAAPIWHGSNTRDALTVHRMLLAGEQVGASFAHLRGVYLLNMDLRRADFRGADLTDTYLTGSNLTNADLAYASLTGATLKGATLIGADLFRADLSGATLINVNLRGAVLTGADLTGANLTGAKGPQGRLLTRADLTGATLTHVKGLS